MRTQTETPAPLADWRTDQRLKEPAKAVAEADAAVAEAERRRDAASAAILAADAELAQCKDLKAAEGIEDRREAAIDAETKAIRERERAIRARDRAESHHAPLALAAKQACAAELRAEWARRALDVAAAVEELKARAERLREVNEHVEESFPREHGHGLAGEGAEAFNEPPLLGLYPRLLMTMLGRGHEKADSFVALAREWAGK